MKPKKSKSGNLFILLGILLIAASLALTANNLWEDYYADREAAHAVLQLQHKILTERENRTNSGVLSSDVLAQSLPAMQMPTIEIDGNQYIGILEIPSLDITLPVLEGWNYDLLKISPSRYRGSYYSDDLVIAGHNYIHHFQPLRWIELNSDVYLVNAEGTVYCYYVASVETLRPQQMDDLLDGDGDLTLFTCTPSGNARCVVRCFRAVEGN